jgi:HEAT repeat protein
MSLFGPPNVVKLEAKRDVEGLTRALGCQKDWGMRRFAAIALGQCGDSHAVDTLAAALEGGDDDMRRSAADGLVAIYQSAKLDEARKAVIPAQREVITGRHHDFVPLCFGEGGWSRRL